VSLPFEPSRIRACVFDAYGTLLDFASAVAGERAVLGERADPLNALWRRKQLEYTWLRALMRRHADFRRVTADALDHALAALGIADPALRERLLAAYDRLDPYPEVPATLERLAARGLRLAILSNGTQEMLASGVESAGLGAWLEAVLSVEEVGVFKPAPEVYLLASRRLGLAAREIAFLSANAWDAHGAASFGFHAIRVDRDGTPAERLPGALAAEIPSLAELPALLGHGA